MSQTATPPEELHLLYLHGPLLTDRVFLRDFFARMGQMKAHFLLLYSAVTSEPEQLRFIGKRLSALLSEALLPNLEFSGDQRGLLQPSGEGFRWRTELIWGHLSHVQGLVLNTLYASGTAPAQAPALQALPAARHQLGVTQLTLFPSFPASPLSQQVRTLDRLEQLRELETAYEEERPLLELARLLLPLELAGARTFTLHTA